MLTTSRAHRMTLCLVAVVSLMAQSCGGSGTASTSSSPSSTAPAAVATTQAAVPTTAACSGQPVTITKPGNWKMVKDFAGEQTWEGIGTVANPNKATVLLMASRTFALTDVKLATGKSFQSYTSNPRAVLPAGTDRERLIVLAGRTIEVVYSMTLVRPTSITTAEVFATVIPENAPTFPTCFLPVSGASPVSNATRGPRLCGQGAGLDDREVKAVVGVAGPSDQPACG